MGGEWGVVVWWRVGESGVGGEWGVSGVGGEWGLVVWVG